MDDFLDTLWFKILALLELAFNLMSGLLAPLNFLGPAALIFLITLLLVTFTKIATRYYNTKRYQDLKANYEHWFEVRRQAMASEDPEKGKALAKNIDQAELNKAYYDYFFEGFLKNILTSTLPVLLTATFIIKAYKPANLQKIFGQPHVFSFSGSGDKPVVIGALFWFVISLLLIHILWFIGARLYKKHVKADVPKDRQWYPQFFIASSFYLHSSSPWSGWAAGSYLPRFS